jgi:hypothetical protein
MTRKEDIMNIQSILLPLLTNLISKVLSNQFSKQHINNDIEQISSTVEEHVRAGQVERDATILMLEGKLKSLMDKLDDIVNAKIDEIVKKVQDKTPFFLDPVVQKFGDEIKREFDVFTDKGVDNLINYLEEKAASLGILKIVESTPTEASVEVEKEPEVVPHVETQVEEVVSSKDGYDFLSEENKEILEDLKAKHKKD